MHFPKLTPLQSRFAATFTATLFLFLLYLAFSSPRFAYAADVPSSISNADHNHPTSIGALSDGIGEEKLWLELGDFDIVEDDEELELVRRAAAGVTALGNNQFSQNNINPGETQYFVFPKEAVTGAKSAATEGLPAFVSYSSDDDGQQTVSRELKRRDDDLNLSKRSTTVYISMTTCSQPSANQSSTNSSSTPPPQLQVYISLSLEKPGPTVDNSSQTEQDADGGYMGTEIEATGDVYVSVSAPNSTGYSGIYTYELAASIDAYFHSIVADDPFLYWVDGDINAVLLETNNVTESASNSENYKQWMNITPPYTVFASNTNDTSIIGMEKSYCALSQYAQISKNTNNVQVGMTNRGMGNKPKEQFYITGLNRSSTYYGILAMDGNSTSSGNGIIGGGGTVWQAMNFSTKADDNCAVLFNLSFCSEVAYAVPSNPSLNVTQLTAIYDDNAAALYKNFSYSLQQIQCNATDISAYSLAVGCDDCAAAYKQWLCAVTIPRCADFSNNADFLRVRNAAQAFLNGTEIPRDSPLVQSPVESRSRNSLIDTEIKPGPYKEILPCQDLCFDLVRNCPASLKFSCPDGAALNASYGYRNANGDITCSYLGAAYYLSHSWSFRGQALASVYTLAVFWATIWVFA